MQRLDREHSIRSYSVLFQQLICYFFCIEDDHSTHIVLYEGASLLGCIIFMTRSAVRTWFRIGGNAALVRRTSGLCHRCDYGVIDCLKSRVTSLLLFRTASLAGLPTIWSHVAGSPQFWGGHRKGHQTRLWGCGMFNKEGAWHHRVGSHYFHPVAARFKASCFTRR